MAKVKLFPAKSNLGGSTVTAGWNLPEHLVKIATKHGRFSEKIEPTNTRGVQELYAITEQAKSQLELKEQNLLEREKELAEKEAELNKKTKKI